MSPQLEVTLCCLALKPAAAPEAEAQTQCNIRASHTGRTAPQLRAGDRSGAPGEHAAISVEKRPLRFLYGGRTHVDDLPQPGPHSEMIYFCDGEGSVSTGLGEKVVLLPGNVTV